MATLLVLLGCATDSSPENPRVAPDPVEDAVYGAVLPPDPDFQWGIYQIYHGPDRFRPMLDHSISELASPPQLITFYRDLGRGFPRAGCEIIRDLGAVPVISLELWRWGDPQTNYLVAVADGGYDGYFQRWAEDALAYGDSVFLRFGFEMNGDWFSWGNQPETFIRAWRRVRGLFDHIGADNVIWVWAPNNVSIPRTEDNAISHYFPGARQVDWVGVDGYNFGDHHDQWHRWEPFDEVFGPALETLRILAPDHPCMIAEFASAPGQDGQKARWIVDAYRSIRLEPRIKGAIWFNLDKRREREPNWRIGSDAGSLEAFNLTFANPKWLSTGH